MSRSVRFLSIANRSSRALFLTLVFIFCLQLTGRLASAQEPVVYEPTSEPVAPEPEPMAWQPPADASDLADFTPPAAITFTVPVDLPSGVPITVTVEPPSAPVTSTVIVTPTLFLTSTGGVSATVALNGLLTHVVSFDEGQVAVVIEEETVASNAELQFTAVPIPVYPVTYTHTLSNPAETRTLMQFQLDVMQNGVMVNEFEKPVRIVVDLRGLTEGLDPTYAGNYFLAYQDEADPTLWHDVPITIHQADGLISAEVTHFSTWVSGTRPTYWKPTFTPPTVSSFSGAAVFSQGIETPPGRNSLQPNIALSYSSRALDGLIQDTDAGEVAHG